MTLENDAVHLKPGALREVARIVDSYRQTNHPDLRVLLVVDQAAATASGADTALAPVMSASRVSRFSGFELNPKIEDIQRGVEQSLEFDPELVIALGGGTAIDLGKLIAALPSQPDKARDIVTGMASISRSGPPLIAIPTTAGTGSEATHFAVAYVDGEKYSVAHDSLLPDHAIIDPSLSHSLPTSVSAATGLDAFCQAVESIWAVGATDQSIGFAIDATRYALQNLVQATNAPTPESRLGMCQAAHLAGKAINISKTTASHALSYRLTSHHNIPHGTAVALTLSSMLAYNAQVTAVDCMDPRGAANIQSRISIIVQLLGANSVPEACQKIDQFISKVGCPISLAEANIQDEQDLQRIASSVNAQRMSNNPRKIEPAALLDLLRENASDMPRHSRWAST